MSYAVVEGAREVASKSAGEIHLVVPNHSCVLCSPLLQCGPPPFADLNQVRILWGTSNSHGIFTDKRMSKQSFEESN